MDIAAAGGSYKKRAPIVRWVREWKGSERRGLLFGDGEFLTWFNKVFFEAVGLHDCRRRSSVTTCNFRDGIP